MLAYSRKLLQNLNISPPYIHTCRESTSILPGSVNVAANIVPQLVSQPHVTVIDAGGAKSTGSKKKAKKRRKKTRKEKKVLPP